MELDEDELIAELVNGSDDVLSADPRNYEFYQLVDGEWKTIVPRIGQVLKMKSIDIAPGDRRRWQIDLDTTDLGSLSPTRKSPREREYQTFTFRFPPGTYAFGFPVSFTYRDQRVNRLYARKFTVIGEDLPLVPSAKVSGARYEGSTVVVRTQTSSDGDQRISLVLDTVENPPWYAETVSLFDLYNPYYEREATGDFDVKLLKLLRDAFAHADPSIDRIRVETTARPTTPVGLQYGESGNVTYAGRGWELEVSEGW